MTKKQWKIVIGINMLVALLASLQFLPGPRGLVSTVTLIYSIIQFASIFGIIFIIIGVIQTVKRVEKSNRGEVVNYYKPVLTWTIPLTMFMFSLQMSRGMADFSRNYAINNARDIIKAIEKYKNDNRRYPSQLTAIVPKYLPKIPSPGIMGIPGYYYASNDSSYTISFDQNVLFWFNWEVVTYDPLDKHKSESGDLFDPKRTHWKYYIFD